MNLLKAAKLALESLKELVADPEIDFGPSYALAQERQKRAIKVLRKAIKETVPQIHDLFVQACEATPDTACRFLEMARLVEAKHGIGGDE